jgi:hypothetical protein
MPDWALSVLTILGSLVVTAAVVGIAWGSFSQRVQRLEEDMKQKVDVKLHDAHIASIEKALAEMRDLLKDIRRELLAQARDGSGAWPPSPRSDR